MDAEINHLTVLRSEIAQLLDDALRAEERHDRELQAAEDRHVAELERRDELHLAETGRRDQLHIDETRRRDDLHVTELYNLRQALETRDVIGQAKGIIMATRHCSADEAFDLLRKQSQHENVKLVDIAIEVAHRTARVNGTSSR